MLPWLFFGVCLPCCHGRQQLIFGLKWENSKVKIQLIFNDDRKKEILIFFPICIYIYIDV